jgi:hypothetical protein
VSTLRYVAGQHTGPRAEVFLLLLIAKHQKRSSHGGNKATKKVTPLPIFSCS